MSTFMKSRQASKWSAISLAMAIGLASGVAAAGMMDVKLSGDQEVPAVKSAGAGSGSITVGDDGSVSGSVTATGFTPTAAHIHMG
ncbi:MAG: CHRD domain-containing protein, partial [Betaproteobacteria bacterium]